MRHHEHPCGAVKLDEIRLDVAGRGSQVERRKLSQGRERRRLFHDTTSRFNCRVLIYVL